MSIRIGLVDYGMGNRRSVQKALEHVGARVELTSDHELLGACAGLVLPGVGAFPRAMGNLHDLGLVDFIRDQVSRGMPLLGICLGMQLLLDGSDELEPCEGLGLIRGRVSWLQTGGLRIPHIGWSDVRFERRSPLTEGLPRGGCPFYHVHSLAARPSDREHVVGSTEYGERFPTIIGHEHVFGVQFHPEKSSADGLRLLSNFAELCGGGRAAQGSRAAARA